jgi:hypothetical protein
MNRLEVTESLYTQVTQMWYNYLRRLLQSRVVFSDMDAVLGKKDDDNEDDATSSSKLGKTNFSFFVKNIFSFLDLSTEAEAHNTLETLLAYRLETYQSNPMIQELNKIHHCLTILYFLAREYIQVHDSMNKIKDCTIKEIDDDQQRILKFLEQLGQLKALMKRQQQN